MLIDQMNLHKKHENLFTLYEYCIIYIAKGQTDGKNIYRIDAH